MLKKIFCIISLVTLSLSITAVSAKQETQETQETAVPLAIGIDCQNSYQRCTARLSPFSNVSQSQCYNAFRYCQAQGVFIIR